jgi:excisionase family DNA binding protein
MATAERIDPLLCADEVAQMLNVSVRTVHRLAEDGRLERVRLGHRTIRYRPENVAELIGSAYNDDTPAANGRVGKTGDDHAHVAV